MSERDTPHADYEFSETRQERTVKIVNAESGQATMYILREMMEPDIREWMKFQATRVAGGRKGRPSLNDMDFTDFNANLIHLCLYEADGATRVPVDKISKWPAKTLNGLFDLCQTMNALNDEGREDAKKA